jgi:hypothetical protein
MYKPVKHLHSGLMDTQKSLGDSILGTIFRNKKFSFVRYKMPLENLSRFAG